MQTTKVRKPKENLEFENYNLRDDNGVVISRCLWMFTVQTFVYISHILNASYMSRPSHRAYKFWRSILCNFRYSFLGSISFGWQIFLKPKLEGITWLKHAACCWKENQALEPFFLIYCSVCVWEFSHAECRLWNIITCIHQAHALNLYSNSKILKFNRTSELPNSLKNIFQRFMVDSSLARNVATDVNQSTAT
jgi:hypothetical protein